MFKPTIIEPVRYLEAKSSKIKLIRIMIISEVEDGGGGIIPYEYKEKFCKCT